MSAADLSQTTTVCRVRADHRLREIAGFALVVWTLAQNEVSVPSYALEAVANSLLFSITQLCEEHGLNDEGARS